MVDLVLHTFNQVTMGYCDSVATRNLALLVTSACHSDHQVT